MIYNRDIACVVILYNPDECVKKYIELYETLVGEIILVDNSSNSNRYLFEAKNNFQYIPLFNNLGIAAALNIGISACSKEYIITMDQDSVINRKMIACYLDYINLNGVLFNGAITPQYATDRAKVRKNKSGVNDVVFSMQSGTLFKKSVFDRIGYFNESLFIEAVDYEFFLRMQQNGIRLVRINDAVLKHQPATTNTLCIFGMKIKYGKHTPERYYYQARNLYYTARKYSCFYMYFLIIVKFFKIIVLFDNKKRYLHLFFKGIKDACVGKMGVLEEF